MRALAILVSLSCIAVFGSCGSDREFGPNEGQACLTEGADDFQSKCDGDALLYCVCDDFEGDRCPDGEGTWVRQDIFCTCQEFMAGTCPVG